MVELAVAEQYMRVGDGTKPLFGLEKLLFEDRSEAVEHDGALDLLDGLRDLDASRAGLAAVEGRSASEHAALLGQHLEAFLSALVPRVEDESVGVHDGCGADVAVVAPVDRA
jgi:hypothetical protein